MRCESGNHHGQCTEPSDGREYMQACVHEHIIIVHMCAFHASHIGHPGRFSCYLCEDSAVGHECPVQITAVDAEAGRPRNP